MGDFNGRVRKKQDQERCLGYFSDTTNERNSNGEELISLCFEQDLTITNTLFKHRISHTQTWYRWSNLDQSSQIDFILVRQKHKNKVTDSRVFPNVSIDTDHRPVVLTQRRNTKNRKIVQKQIFVLT
jgi:exonuclease III